MNDDHPQDKHRSEPSKADQASKPHSGDSPISGADSSVTHSRELTEGGEGARAAAVQDAAHELEHASGETQTHVNALQKPGEVSSAKESVQSIPLTLPQGGNPAEHLTPEQLLETDTSRRRTREVSIQSPSAVPLKELVRYDNVLFAPKVPPTALGDRPLDDSTKPVGRSPFQPSGPESSEAQPVTDSDVPDLPPSETVGSAESENVPEGADPALPSDEASGEQRRPLRGDRPPWARTEFEGIEQLSDPNATPSAAAASSGAGATPPQSSSSTTARVPSAGENAAPLPRVIVMVSLDDAKRIVHEEMHVFSRELAIVAREIALEEVTNAQFDYQAQLRALIR